MDANEALVGTNDTKLTLKVLPSPFVNVIVLMFTDAVTIAFGVFDAVAAYEAEVAVAAVEANEADNAYDADINSDEDVKYCVKSKRSKSMKKTNKKTNKKIYKIHDLLNKLKL